MISAHAPIRPPPTGPLRRVRHAGPRLQRALLHVVRRGQHRAVAGGPRVVLEDQRGRARRGRGRVRRPLTAGSPLRRGHRRRRDLGPADHVLDDDAIHGPARRRAAGRGLRAPRLRQARRPHQGAAARLGPRSSRALRARVPGMKPLYTARATVTGGRDQGHGRTDDGALEVDLRMPKEMGGEGGGTNPEQLFAVGYASCFESALKLVARRQKVDADDVSVASAVTLTPTPERAFILSVELDVTLPSVQDADQAVQLVELAHKVCPYSNATRGNIDVALTANGRPIGAVAETPS